MIKINGNRSLARGVAAGVALGLALALAGCGSDDAQDDTASTPVPTSADSSTQASTPAETEPALEGAITVFAAASLTETFTELGEAFEAANPGVTVTFSFGASSTLAQQINSGAPADVFAAASPSTMAQVVDEGGAADEPTVFVSNRLEIAVPPGNPGGVTGLADFANPDLKIALCAEEVPCGAAAVKVFEAAGITPAPDTYEQDVKATLSKVELGEVDAALVYRTDVIAAGDAVEGIEFPEADEAVNDYPIAVLTDSALPDIAAAFVAYVLSPEGQQVLTDAGFDSA